MTTPPKRVAIIGAGLAGPVVAISLFKQGILSTIYETRSEPTTFGAGITMAPNACRVLQDLGILERVKKVGYIFEKVYLYGDNGKDLGFHYQGHEANNGFKAIRVERTVLHRILIDAAKELGVKTHFGKKFTRFEESDNGVAVFFEDGSVEYADLLVGCDGWQSKVRKQMLGTEIRPVYSGFCGIAGFAEIKNINFPDPGYNNAFMIFSKDGHFGFTPIDPYNERATWFISCELEDRSREEWEEFRKTQALTYAKAMLKGAGEPVTSTLNSLQSQEVTIHAHHIVPDIETWHRGRVVILGDAAHCIPPHGGQGAAQAFEDGFLLSRELAALSQKWTLLEALNEWQSYRMARLKIAAKYTESSGNIRKRSSYLGQLWKEWKLWAYFKLWPEQVGSELYSYDLKAIKVGGM